MKTGELTRIDSYGSNSECEEKCNLYLPLKFNFIEC